MMASCATERIIIRNNTLSQAALDSLNDLLASADVELVLRGGAALPPAFRMPRRYVLHNDVLQGIGSRDTVTLPIDYIAQLRGSHRRSGSRLIVGAAGGFLVGTAVVVVLAPSAPVAIGIGGLIVGMTAAALSSDRFVIRFDDRADSPH